MPKESALARLPLGVKFAIVSAAAVALGVAYYLVFYTEVQAAIESAQGRERDLRDDLGKAKKSVAVYQTDLAELHQREQRQTEIEKVLPSESQYPSFLSSLQAVANVSSVNLVAWAPQPEHSEEFYARVPMRLELSGRFHQVVKFFHGVGQLDRIINMENISITEPKIQGDDVVVKVEVLATAFRSVSDNAASGDKTKARTAATSAASGGGNR
jgi:type IV pilus assembly protein PilO